MLIGDACFHFDNMRHRRVGELSLQGIIFTSAGQTGKSRGKNTIRRMEIFVSGPQGPDLTGLPCKK